MEKELFREAMRGNAARRSPGTTEDSLLGDLIKHSIESKKWRPVPVLSRLRSFQKFVDWKAARHNFGDRRGFYSLGWPSPVTLYYWLRVKGVVNDEGIR